MKNSITFTTISPLTYVDASSRYINSSVIYYNTDAAQYITFTTYKKPTQTTSSSDIYTVISKKYEYRPDLLANDVYSDPRLWWKIMEANNINDVYNFKAGINIRIPRNNLLTMACQCNISDYLFDPDTGTNLLDPNINPFNQPIQAAILTPWVKIAVNGSPDDPDAQIITVGNQSQGPTQQAAACIKSFQYGFSDGFKVIFEIVDIEGGNFCNFVSKLAKNLQELQEGNIQLIQFKWGWIVANCGGTTGYTNDTSGINSNTCLPISQQNSLSSSVHTAVLTSIMPVLENGMFKFTLECTDLSDIHMQQVIDAEFKQIPLTLAILQLFKLYAVPPVTSVIYQLRQSDGTILSMPIAPIVPFFNSNNGQIDQFNGPTVQWSGLGRNPLSILRGWLNGVTSINDQGFKYAFNPGQCGINLIIKENDKPGCEKFAPEGIINKRVYVVNGGIASKVISFQPHIRWIYMQELSAGGRQAANVQKDIAAKNVEDCRNQGANQDGAKSGISSSYPPNSNMDAVNGSDAARLQIQADKANFLAENAFEAITAELRIQGDPTLEFYDRIGEFINIVVINAFIPSSSPNKCDWTIQTVNGDPSACNSILSNTNWIIDGASHNMVEGSYTTTLKVSLAAPGIDFDIFRDLGGGN